MSHAELLSRPEDDNRLKVYISSTFLDLEQYRTTLIREFEGTYASGFRLSTVMERMFQDGRDHRPILEICLDEVKESKIYFLIVDSRSGACPPGMDKTYTEYEYDTALADKNNKLIYRFVSKEINEEKFGALQEKDQQKIKQFRERLRKEDQMINEFSDINSFKAEFQARMSYSVMYLFPGGPISGRASNRRFYKVLAALVSGIGLIATALSSYFLYSTLSLSAGITALFALLLLLLFACIVVYILKDVWFPTSLSTLKTKNL